MFWKRFKELSKEKNITQKEIAKLCNLTDSAVSSWKKGFIPHKPTLIILANYFGVSIDYLIGYTNIRPENQNKKTETEEKQIIESYNNASEDTKTAIKRILNLA